MQFGPYTVERLLEQHGPLALYMAENQTNGKRVLLSVFKPDSIVAAQQWTERLKAVQRLQHPHVVRTIEGGLTPTGEQYAVTPAVPPLLGGGRVLTPKSALEAARQISEALDFAHQQGIAHGALSPAYIVRIGPEQVALRGWELAGETATASMAGDIAGLSEFVRRALVGPQSTKRPIQALPRPLEDVLSNALPGGTGYQSADAFYAALAEAVGTLPPESRVQSLVDAPTVSVSAPGAEKARRHRNQLAVFIFLAAVAVMIVAVTAFFLSQGTGATLVLPTALAAIPTDTPTPNTTAVYDSSDATALPSATLPPTFTPLPPEPTEPPPSPLPLGVITATTGAFTLGPTSTDTPTALPTETDTPTATAVPAKPCISLVGDSVTHGGVTYEVPGTGYVVGLTHPLAEFFNNQLRAQGINDLIAYDRGASNTGINSLNHISYFNSQAYVNLLEDHCKFTVIMPWYNDITPGAEAQSNAAPEHVRAIIGLVNTLIDRNPEGRIIVMNYYQGNVSDFAATTWAQGFTPDNRYLYNHEIGLSCDVGSLSKIMQVSCYNTDDAFQGMGTSYVIDQIGHDELMNNLVAPLSPLQQGWLNEYFASNPGGQLQGDGIHLNSAGKTALSIYLIQATQALPDLSSSK